MSDITRHLKLIIEGDDKASEAIKGAKEQTKEAKQATDEWSLSAKNLTSALKSLGITVSALGAAKWLKGSVEAWAQEEKSISLLSNTLRLVGQDYGVLGKQIEEYAAKRQKTTLFGDEQTRLAVTELVRITGEYNETTLRSVQLAQDMAAAMGIDATSAARMLGIALEGNVQILARQYLPSLRQVDAEQIKAMDSGERLALIHEHLAKAFEGAAEKSGKTGIMMARLASAYDDFRESAGKSLQQSGLFPAIFNAMADAINAVTAAGERFDKWSLESWEKEKAKLAWEVQNRTILVYPGLTGQLDEITRAHERVAVAAKKAATAIDWGKPVFGQEIYRPFYEDWEYSEEEVGPEITLGMRTTREREMRRAAAKAATGGRGRGGRGRPAPKAADWGWEPYRPFYEDWGREPEEEMGPEITAGMRTKREREVNGAWKRWEAEMVAGETIMMNAALAANSVNTALETVGGALSQLSSVALQASWLIGDQAARQLSGMLGGGQQLAGGIGAILGGDYLSGGIGLLGGMLGIAGSIFGEESDRSRRGRGYTAANPLPVRVVNPEAQQQVQVYNVIVQGSLVRDSEVGRYTAEAQRRAERSGMARRG